MESIEQFVKSVVEANGYGPWYQRDAWNRIAQTPLPRFSTWERFYRHLLKVVDEMYPPIVRKYTQETPSGHH